VHILILAKQQPTANTNIAMGLVGVSFNGVIFFGNSDMQGQDAYFFQWGEIFDQCNGHAAPRGVYLYHAQTSNECFGHPVDASAHAKLARFMVNSILSMDQRGITESFLKIWMIAMDTLIALMPFTIMGTEYQYPYLADCLCGKMESSFFLEFVWRKWKRALPLFRTHWCLELLCKYRGLQTQWYLDWYK
jgi:hypothetical protein